MKVMQKKWACSLDELSPTIIYGTSSLLHRLTFFLYCILVWKPQSSFACRKSGCNWYHDTNVFLSGLLFFAEKVLSIFQDYIDSMEGATLSGRQASAYICNVGEELVTLRKKLEAAEAEPSITSDELSFAR